MKDIQLKKQFLKAVLPSMMAFMFSGVYAIVDGFFVGRNVGDNGLAAVNLAYPIVALIQSIGTGIGMGGAIWVSIAIGRGHEKEQQGYLKTTLYLLTAASIIATAVLLFISSSLLRVFGAEGITLLYAERYIRIIIYGAILQILGTGIIPLLRNYDGSFAVMISIFPYWQGCQGYGWLCPWPRHLWPLREYCCLGAVPKSLYYWVAIKKVS